MRFRSLVVWVLALFMVSESALAGLAVPSTYNAKVNTAISQNLQTSFIKRGFAANDPRYGATLDAVSNVATTAAMAVGGGVVAGATWPAILAGVGISAVASVAVPWVMNKAINWLWGSGTNDGKVQLSGADMGTGDPTKLPGMPATYPLVFTAIGPNGSGFFYDTSGGQPKVRMFRTLELQCVGMSSCGVPAPYSNLNLNEDFATIWDSQTTHRFWARRQNVLLSSVKGAGGNYTNTYDQVWELTTPTTNPITAPYQGTYKSPADLVNDLPADAANQPVTAQMMADALNALWKKAAENNPNVLPWSAADPIKAGEVQPWLDANPNGVPKGGDWFSPVSPAGGTAVPIPKTGIDPGGNPGNGGDPSTGTGPTCGGTGQPRCGVDVDDSGFDGKSADASGLSTQLDKLDANYQARVDANQGDHGVSWRDMLPDLRFGMPKVGCQAIPLDLTAVSSGLRFNLDICDNPLIVLIKQIEAWALYVFTAFYIWRRFRSSEVPAGAEQ
ncbi:hypothetical protein AU374_00989 [Cupriavidus metallidurans]|uniref:hypothetical protein n=1 Tax=Cupriavidus metallidurans TaxID=119219 RepID=UPI000763912D|nr:hypothetical protein [Cupriavidus metallidurans]KWW38203.1 hypothetical protein AU374_00989 [Cupriavidus metallidurans]